MNDKEFGVAATMKPWGLIETRTRKGLSKKALADLLAVSQDDVGAWEEKAQPVPKKLQDAMSRMFKKPKKYLFELTEADREIVIDMEVKRLIVSNYDDELVSSPLGRRRTRGAYTYLSYCSDLDRAPSAYFAEPTLK